MPDFVVTEPEQWALASCSGVAVKAYLRLRARMDFDSGVVGVRTGVSYQALREWTEEEVEKGKGMMRVQPSVQAIRTALGQLVRRGLLVRRRAENLVFLMPMARTGSVRANQTQQEPNRGKTGERRTIPNAVEDAGYSSLLGGFDGLAGCEPNTTPNTNSTGVNPANGTHIREPIKTSTFHTASTTDNGGARGDVESAACGLANKWTGPGAVGGDGEQTSPQMRKAAGLVALLRKRGVRCNTQDPRLLAWVADGLDEAFIFKAVDVAKDRRGDSPQPVNVGLLDTIARGLADDAKRPAKKAADAWWLSDAATEAKGRELGMQARPGESYPDFRGRIRVAIDQAGAA